MPWLESPAQRLATRGPDSVGTKTPAPNPITRGVVLRASALETHFPIRRGLLRRVTGSVRAVDGVDLEVYEGETLGLVGESGSGKTTFGRTVTRLVDPTGGTVEFAPDGQLVDITRMSQGELRRVRRHMNMVFQDPLSSLNPRMNVKTIVGEPLILHGVARGRALEERVAALLQVVGLRPEHMHRFPHAFSGGQRQRIAVARALALHPKFVVADEPVSALDASVKSQILNLFMDLQAALRLTYLFISHDLAVVRHVSDRIAVMYLGKIVELGPARALCEAPLHPYTEALLAVIPVPVPGHRRRFVLPGDLPDPAHPPGGCRFSTRCRYKQPVCEQEAPPLREMAPGQWAACHFAGELALAGVAGPAV